MADNGRGLSRLDLAVASLLVLGGYTVAACKLAALSWDGSWYLFRTLQDQVPLAANGRVGTYPILSLLVRASSYVDDSRTLGILYGLLLSLIPVGSLALSWWFLRDEKHAPLRVWPAIGVLLTPLPGQFCIMSEGTLVAQLLWPILAIIAVNPFGITGGICLAVLAVAAGALHPTSVLIFLLAAVLFGWRAWKGWGAVQGNVLWASAFVLFAVAKLVLTFFFVTDYERGQFSLAKMKYQFVGSLLGWPIVLLGLTYLLGVVLLVPAEAARRWHPRLSWQAVCGLICAAMLVVGLEWVSHASYWRGVLDYRRFVLPAAFPVVAMAVWHFLRLKDHEPATRPSLHPWLLSGIAAVFGLVLVTQALVWGSLLNNFSDALARQAAATHERFVDAGELPLMHHTPLEHWTACPLSILLQGRRPRVLLVARREDIHPASVKVNFWEDIPLVDGWFILEPLKTAEPVTK